MVMTLLSGLAAVALVSSSPQVAQAAGIDPGQRGAAANPFYVYVQAGEYITAHGGPGTHPNGASAGMTRVVDPEGNEYPISADVNYFTAQATQDGVWKVHYDPRYPHGTWEINVTTGDR